MDRSALELNDDCFLEIFENLSVPELADVASTHTRLQTIARDVFSHRHKSNCLDIDLYDRDLNGFGPAARRTGRRKHRI